MRIETFIVKGTIVLLGVSLFTEKVSGDAGIVIICAIHFERFRRHGRHLHVINDRQILLQLGGRGGAFYFASNIKMNELFILDLI